jgi:hypothetical protein
VAKRVRVSRPFCFWIALLGGQGFAAHEMAAAIHARTEVRRLLDLWRGTMGAA